MGPELLSPQQFGFKDSRPTRHSDCYALGMVVYGVLCRHASFHRDANLVVFGHVIEGKRPERPQGMEKARFTDDMWRALERCWTRQPDSRPSIEDVLQCLEKASRSWIPPPPWMTGGVQATDLPSRNPSDSSVEGNTDGGEVPPPSQASPPQPPLELLQKGDPDENNTYSSTDESSVLLYQTPDHRDLGAHVKNSKGSNLEQSIGIPDRVGGTGFLDGFWY